MRSRSLSIIGSTGSIGQNGAALASEFSVNILACNTNIEVLSRQVLNLKPKVVCVGDEIYEKAKSAFSCKVYRMVDLPSILQSNHSDVILYSISGNAGLIYIKSAIESCKTLALANKECIVSAWDFISPIAAKSGTNIIPVDSEHNSLYQLFEHYPDASGAFITASGGPFFGKKFVSLSDVTPDVALSHPTWTMGGKITIDSATMANKALELIEACSIFGKSANFFDVFIERRSVCHAGVYTNKGVTVPLFAVPDMKIHIAHAMDVKSFVPQKVKMTSFDFHEVSKECYPIFFIGKGIAEGGDILDRIIFNLANEVAVLSFLNNKIKYTEIYDVIQRALDEKRGKSPESLDDIIDYNRSFAI